MIWGQPALSVSLQDWYQCNSMPQITTPVSAPFGCCEASETTGLGLTSCCNFIAINVQDISFGNCALEGSLQLSEIPFL